MIISNMRKNLLKFAVLIVILIIVIVPIILVTTEKKDNKNEGTVDQRVAGVVSNGIECAEIGMNVLKKNGSAVDAAIATLFCEGIACPQSTGLGGGLLATIYIKKSGVVRSLNAREVAPKNSHEHMFDENPSDSIAGSLSVAVPGELKGMWALHQEYGILDWSDLIQPSIELCRKGHKVSKYLATSLRDRENKILNDIALKEIFINPSTGRTYVEGDTLKRIKLAETLEIVAKEGANALYSINGSLLKNLLDDINERGGIFTEADFLEYKEIWTESVSMDLDDMHKLYTNPLPSSGPSMIFMLNILKKYNLTDSPLSYHRIVEAFKFGHARKKILGDDDSDEILKLVQRLIDPKYADEIRLKINDSTTFDDFEYYGGKVSSPDDHGTAHISILAPNGDAVAVTSTINFILGSLIRSRKTGIILNNEMNDFAFPNSKTQLAPSPSNFVRPGKRPLSSMVPTIVVNKDGNVRLVTGGAGGSKITSSVVFIICEHFLKKRTLQEAIYHSRFHHQLEPMTLQYESDFDSQIINELKTNFKHNVSKSAVDAGFAAITGLSVIDGKIEAVSDKRRKGSDEIWIPSSY